MSGVVKSVFRQKMVGIYTYQVTMPRWSVETIIRSVLYVVQQPRTLFPELFCHII